MAKVAENQRIELAETHKQAIAVRISTFLMSHAMFELLLLYFPLRSGRNARNMLQKCDLEKAKIAIDRIA